MKRAFLFAVLLIPQLAFAAEPISRADAFIRLWESIKRPAAETRETPFSDVPKGSPGFLEITFAKYRGILDDAEVFDPKGPLAVGDALLWLYRTANIDDPDLLTPEHLWEYNAKYPLVASGSSLARTLTAAEFDAMRAKFQELLRTEDHEVSLYAEKFHGKGTAFGESFDMHAMTAAHRTFPHNTMVKVTNVANGKSVTVRINDRGPFVKGRDMDLSLGAFTAIAERSKGKIRATFERLGDASLVSSVTAPTRCPAGKRLERLQARAKRRGLAMEAKNCR